MDRKQSAFLPMSSDWATLQRVFSRKHGDWSEVAMEAADWLASVMRERFPMGQVCFFETSSDWMDDTKLNRYKLRSASNQNGDEFDVKKKLDASNIFEHEGRIINVCLSCVNSVDYESAIINSLKNRNMILFICPDEEKFRLKDFNNNMAICLKKLSDISFQPDLRSSDNFLFLSWFAKAGFWGIRTWGFFDDEELSLEIYDPDFSEKRSLM